jgi:hypothetical protein
MTTAMLIASGVMIVGATGLALSMISNREREQKVFAAVTVVSIAAVFMLLLIGTARFAS